MSGGPPGSVERGNLGRRCACEYVGFVYSLSGGADWTSAALVDTLRLWDTYVPEEECPTSGHRENRRRTASSAIFRDVETWYTLRRRHSTLGYLSPAAFEEVHRAAAA